MALRSARLRSGQFPSQLWQVFHQSQPAAVGFAGVTAGRQRLPAVTPALILVGAERDGEAIPLGTNDAFLSSA